ncbi:MAG: cell division protein FtsL [Mollicutes bacterium]|jgi:cell division protein FtsL|nr:cell division protein FtsL [Mollicutes bacterium]
MVKTKKLKLNKIDKVMITILLLLVLISPLVVVFSKSILSRSNIEVEKIKAKVEKQDTINESLTMKINELASLSNIQDIAKEYGLSYINDNIIVIK